jgi:mannose-6-phosphate isomerase-like protein (cupin superfamily)
MQENYLSKLLGQFPPDWNPDYPFEDAAHQAEIQKQDAYDRGNLMDMPAFRAGGGDEIISPWGRNRSLDSGLYPAGDIYSIDPSSIINPADLAGMVTHPYEFCKKDLVVNPDYMLSLQRHRGRQEIWHVMSGILTVILNGTCCEVCSGQSIFVPRGAIHGMANLSSDPVHVVEMQTGVCREADNVRLADFSGRPTYPLTSEIEFRSAQIYKEILHKIYQRLKRVS